MNSNKGHTHAKNCLRDGGGPTSNFCSCAHCTLGVCEVCGCYEGSLTTECSGVKVCYEMQDVIYKQGLDFTSEKGWHMHPPESGFRTVLWKD